MNLVIIEGRLTKDLKIEKSGVANRNYCNNSIAVDRYSKNGEKKEAMFINFTVWEQKAEFLAKYARKGGRIIIEGRLDQNKEFNYEKNINEYQLYIVPTNIHIIDWKQSDTQNNTQSDTQNTNQTGFDFDEVEISDDDLPF